MLAALILPDGTGSVLKGYKIRSSNNGKLTLIHRDKNAKEMKLESHVSEDVIRVVEIRSHPLGFKDLGIVVVLEVTSSTAEAKVQRYLTLDAERTASAVIDIGDSNYCIEVLNATVSQIQTKCCIIGLLNKCNNFFRNGIEQALDGWKWAREISAA